MQQASNDGAHNLDIWTEQEGLCPRSGISSSSILNGFNQSTHCVLSLVGTDEEEQFSDEQVGPQVAVDGAVVCVPGRPLAAQGGKAGRQTHQCYRDADPGNHIDEKLLDTGPELMRRSRREQRQFFLNTSDHKGCMNAEHM